MKAEIWKDIILTSEELAKCETRTCRKIRYEISNLGRVKNKATGNILTPQIKNRKKDGAGGYKNLKLYVGYHSISSKQNKTFAVARLVARAFCANPENKPFVDHINRDSLDNRAENLRWVTQKENLANQAGRREKKRKGVYKQKRYLKNDQYEFSFCDKYTASVAGNYLGTFTSEDEAAAAADKKSKELYGEYAYLNNEN